MDSDKNNQEATLRERERRLAYLMLVPTFLVVFLIVVFPVIWNIWLSFKPITLAELGDSALGGLNLTVKNYQRLFSNPRFVSDLTTTFTYTFFGVSLSLVFGLGAALLLNLQFKGRNVLRGLYLFPYIAPVVAVAYVSWTWMLNPTFGVVPWALQKMGLLGGPVGFLSAKPFALISIIAFQAWRYFPFCFLFILAKLQSIPDHFYEAADVAGATPIQKFFHVTLPQIRGILATVFLLRFMWTFTKFDDVFLLTKGSGGTEIMPILVYEYFIGRQNIGTGSAAAVTLFGTLGVFLFFYFRYVMEEW